MVKNFLVTYGGLDSLAAINAGTYDNIRLMSGTSESAGLDPQVPPTHPWRRAKDAAALQPSDSDSWWQFSAVMWHFAEALTDQHKAAGRAAPTIGLVSTAIGGSQIEEWITNAEAMQCFGYEHDANGGFLNHVCWDANVRPFLDMTIKGVIYYQVRDSLLLSLNPIFTAAPRPPIHPRRRKPATPTPSPTFRCTCAG